MTEAANSKAKGKEADAPCPHDHIRHETKSRTVCKDCGMTMSRNRGDWVGKEDER